jgi:hypothetical protein
MPTEKSNLKSFHIALARVGVMSVAALARKIGCSRTAIYLAMERPQRYPVVYQNIQKVLEGSTND